jgi:hypothetical protein
MEEIMRLERINSPEESMTSRYKNWDPENLRVLSHQIR